MVLRVGLLGCGTVGSGTVDILRNDPNIKFVKILVRDEKALHKRCQVPADCKVVSNAKDILDDANVDCVIDVMGGTGLAWEYTKKALESKKHFVTANKACLSKHMGDIAKLLKDNPSLYFYFEASVCGGIPIINTLQRGLACDKISKVMGILNGTTNFLMTKMEKEGYSYQQALQEAQNRGYAEADPAADVDGFDARSKICIMTKLAFGLTVNESEVYCEGISKVLNVDFEYGKMINRTIKLLGLAEDVGNGDVCVTVSPVLIPLDASLAAVDGVTNAVQILSKNLDSTTIVGPGAGREATGNSVAADLKELEYRLRVAPGIPVPPVFPDIPNVKLQRDFSAQFYVRLVIEDRVGIIQSVSSLCAKLDISLNSILQNQIENPHHVVFAIITERCSLSKVQNFCRELSDGKRGAYSFMKEDPIFIRLM